RRGAGNAWQIEAPLHAFRRAKLFGKPFILGGSVKGRSAPLRPVFSVSGQSQGANEEEGVDFHGGIESEQTGKNWNQTAGKHNPEVHAGLCEKSLTSVIFHGWQHSHASSLDETPLRPLTPRARLRRCRSAESPPRRWTK